MYKLLPFLVELNSMAGNVAVFLLITTFVIVKYFHNDVKRGAQTNCLCKSCFSILHFDLYEMFNYESQRLKGYLNIRK